MSWLRSGYVGILILLIKLAKAVIIAVKGQSYFASFIYGFLIVVLLGGRHKQMIFLALSIRLAKKIGFLELILIRERENDRFLLLV